MPAMPDAEFEDVLCSVERRLTTLAQALGRDDATAAQSEAGELQRALAGALLHFGGRQRGDELPPAVRERLLHAGARVAAQREAVARAAAALDRAIDVLLPEGATQALYSAQGTAQRSARGGLLRA